MQKFSTLENGEVHIQQNGIYLVPKGLYLRLWHDGHVQAGNGKTFTPVRRIEIGNSVVMRIEGYEIEVRHTAEIKPKFRASIINLAAYRNKKR